MPLSQNFQKANHWVIYISIYPQKISSYIARNIDTAFLFNTRHIFCKNRFSPSTTKEGNNLNQELEMARVVNLRLVFTD